MAADESRVPEPSSLIVSIVGEVATLDVAIEEAEENANYHWEDRGAVTLDCQRVDEHSERG